MRVTEYKDGHVGRRILIGMITNDAVAGRVAMKWTDRDMFASQWENELGQMCIDYYNRHGHAPGRNIEGIYERWARTQRDEEVAKGLNLFLGGLSAEYEQAPELNADYILDEAKEHFNVVRLRRLITDATAELDMGRQGKALELVDQFSRVDLGAGSAVRVLTDREVVRSTFNSKEGDTLIEYPGALGQFFRGLLERDAFIAFLAPEKTGKSMALLDMAITAVLQRRRVAFFEVGDMSEHQVKRRLYAHLSGHPYRSTNKDLSWPCKVKLPSIVTHRQGDDFSEVEHQVRECKTPLNGEIAWEQCCQTIRHKIKSEKDYLLMGIFPNDTINVKGIRETLRGWERLYDGWTPDVVIIDYADILADPDGKHDNRRESIFKTWKQLRALSQELHCLLVTATQANAASYGQILLHRGNFSDDKRKLAQVTGMIGINVTAQEKEKGLARLNWIGSHRDDNFNKVVHVAGCLAIARPFMRSTF